MVVASVEAHAGLFELAGDSPLKAGTALINPLRRSNAGKSSLAPGFWPGARLCRSITDQCAGGSAWTDWDPLCAFSSRVLSCRAGKCPANAVRRLHRHVWDPREPAAFERAQACQKF